MCARERPTCARIQAVAAVRRLGVMEQRGHVGGTLSFLERLVADGVLSAPCEHTLGTLFSPFPKRAVNATAFNGRIQLWMRIVERLARHVGRCYVTGQDLATHLTDGRTGMKPLPVHVAEAFARLYAANVVCVEKELPPLVRGERGAGGSGSAHTTPAALRGGVDVGGGGGGGGDGGAEAAGVLDGIVGGVASLFGYGETAEQRNQRLHDARFAAFSRLAGGDGKTTTVYVVSLCSEIAQSVQSHRAVAASAGAGAADLAIAPHTLSGGQLWFVGDLYNHVAAAAATGAARDLWWFNGAASSMQASNERQLQLAIAVLQLRGVCVCERTKIATTPQHTAHGGGEPAQLVVSFAPVGRPAVTPEQRSFLQLTAAHRSVSARCRTVVRSIEEVDPAARAYVAKHRQHVRATTTTQSASTPQRTPYMRQARAKLKAKQRLQRTLEHLVGVEDQLDVMLNALMVSLANADAVAALRDGGAALRRMNEAVGGEEGVAALLDECSEAIEETTDIQSALMGEYGGASPAVGTAESDELEQELAALMRGGAVEEEEEGDDAVNAHALLSGGSAGEDAAVLPSMPAAPTVEPVATPDAASASAEPAGVAALMDHLSVGDGDAASTERQMLAG